MRAAKLHRMLAVAALCPLLALVACGKSENASPLAEKQRQEEAINRGDAAPAADAGSVACKRAGGDWKAGAQQCAMTRAMCGGNNAGTWADGVGCSLDVADHAACTALVGNGGLDGFTGVSWSQGRCVMAFMTSAELAQNGY